MFEELVKQQQETFDSELQKLNYYCDNYPNIQLFVEYLIKGVGNKYETWGDYIPGQLEAFLYKLGYSIGVRNPKNFNLSWVSELNSFIGNYFFDDSYFTVKQGIHNVWEIKPANEDDEHYQDPLILINAAKDNAKYYYQLEQNFWHEFQPHYLEV